MKKTFLLAFIVIASVVAMAQEPRQSVVEMETTMGTITLKLYDETPLHRDNFLALVNRGFYDGLLFHRVIKDFMIQGGDPASRDAQPGQELGEGDMNYRLPAEIVFPQLYHKRGVLAAAREGDAVNPERQSSACQFYIVVGQKFNDAMLDRVQQRIEQATGGQCKLTEEQRETYKTIGGTPHLDGQYTVFGEVIEGMDVVEKIQLVSTDANDRPVEDVRIIKAIVKE